MKFTQLLLAAAVTTVAFAEKYAFYVKPEGGDKYPLRLNTFGDYKVLSYDTITGKEPDLFDKVNNVFKIGPFTIGTFDNYFGYGVGVKGYEFEFDEDWDGLITNAWGAMCPRFQDSSTFFAFQLPPENFDDCITSTFYMKVVEDD